MGSSRGKLISTPRVLIAALFVGQLSVANHAQNQPSDLAIAANALGAATLTSLQIAGNGSDFVVGQSYDASSPWPRFAMPSFTLTVDFAQPALRVERTRAQGEQPPRGGALQPLVGDQRLVQLLAGNTVWNETNGRPTSGGTGGAVRGESPGIGLHAPTQYEERLLQMWLIPQGFIKAALLNHARVRTALVGEAKKTIVTFDTPNQLRLEGVLNGSHLLERVETWIEHPVLGDTMIEAVFQDYRDFGGVTFPTRIIHREGGYPVFDLTVTSVKANIPARIDLPASLPASSPTALVQPQKMGEGIWLFPGGNQSMAVEMRDDVVVLDAPTDEAQSIAVIGSIRKLVPQKPIKYVVNTHAHFDHAGGLRAYAAEGAVIITQRDNIPYYEQMWANPRTINPDRLAKSGKRAVFEGVLGSRTLTDGARTLVIYHYPGNAHNSGMLMVFLPQEHLLFEADSFLPTGRPGAAHPAIPNLLQFYEVVQRLRLDVARVVPTHGQLSTFAALQKTVAEAQAALDSGPDRAKAGASPR
jgi:glyoxylase-like metal-dependent hydrolase (beta-lactamase superfamily II)